jgi:peptidoglycan hydrolase-like protein with peptidoglycan-binding domain
LSVRLPRTVPLGSRVALEGRVSPRSAGRLTVRLLRGNRVVRELRGRGTVWARIPTRRVGAFRAEIRLEAAPGFVAVRTVRRTAVRLPELAVGSQGEAVLALERRLRALRYGLPRIDRTYGWDTGEAVLAFRKVMGLPWRTTMDADAWRALQAARVPVPRHGYADHVEVSKTRQVLMLVRGGRVDTVVHVSTGATGNTPVGRWQVYRKVVGWDWVLWYPSYFLRGFAIHGYPSVPAYPASHGCVRVPMWVATRLWSALPHGATIWIDP